ncbi:hypothetical protein G7051_12905 [Dysgonomonas sp. HDW5B]|uniref:hypothetical protein n=1 Tax=Dysgonomonas sp. HDW5B TaxID=2714927 RepID=UPI00140D1218|nr:hypothetical protein [Dysgonomonas sp. HDW5B]QIK55191.1 hypothetical protein G7051_12905 [Dysgonomonas sp. HDW5B]
MKNCFFLIFSLLSMGICQSQVGINTKSPFGAFHIDPNSNTGGTSSSPTNDSDDVIVDMKGNVGIGTANPTASLDLRGTIRINDGTQGSGNIFTTDGTGLGYWDSEFKFKIISGSISNGILLGVGWSVVSSQPLTITAGKWLLSARIVTKNSTESSYYTWVQIYDKTSAVAINAAGARPSYDSSLYCVVQTAGVVEVAAGQTKQIELHAQNHSVFASTSGGIGGSYLYAIKLM